MHDPDGYYKILEIPPQSSVEAVKKAYAKMQMKYNPDFGKLARELKKIENEAEKEKKMQELQEAIFKINTAHEILTDTQKKQLYDQGISEKEMRQGGGQEDSPFGDVFSMFNQFFDTRSSRQRRPRASKPIVQSVKLTLQDSLLGKKAKYRVSRKLACQACDGKGGRDVRTCQGCHGRGVIAIEQRLGGLCIQREAQCPECLGKGESLHGPPCSDCNGKRVISSAKELVVEFPRGVSHGQQLVYKGEGNCDPGTVQGDVVFTVEILPHKMFSRKGDDLICDIRINLFEALMGTTLDFEMLDGRKISLGIPAVKDVRNVIVLPNEGFPTSEGRTGRLIIRPEYTVPQFDKNNLSKALNIAPCKKKATVQARFEEYLETQESTKEEEEGIPFSQFRAFFA